MSAPRGTEDSQSFLIRFYDPSVHAPNAYNRTLPQLLSLPDSKLESLHNYIQTVFPLSEQSGVLFDAPLIDATVYSAFRSRTDLRNELRNSFHRMLRFYGLHISESSLASNGEIGDMSIMPAPGSNLKSQPWISRFNHNHMRITRIIRCLRILGLELEAQAFHAALKNVDQKVCPGKIGKTSLMYWARAAKRPLWIAPDVDDEADWDVDGLSWLREKIEHSRNEDGNSLAGENEQGDEKSDVQSS